MRVRLEMSGAIQELALFNLAIDSKLRACDLVKLKVEDLWSGSSIRDRATIIQKKTKRPVQFEFTEQTKIALAAWLPSFGGMAPAIWSMPSEDVASIVHEAKQGSADLQKYR